MNESQKYYVEWKKPDTKNTHCDSFSVDNQILKRFLQHNSDCHHVLIRITQEAYRRSWPSRFEGRHMGNILQYEKES